MASDPSAIQAQEAAEIKVKPPQFPPELAKFLDRCVQMANEVNIESNEDYDAAFMLRQHFKTNTKVIEGLLDPGIAELHAAHRRETARRAAALDPIQRADKIVETKRIEWDEKQEAIARAKEQEQAKLSQAQRQETAVNEAAELEKIGEHEAAEEILHQAVTAPAPAVYVPPNITKSKGQVKRKKYAFRIIAEDKIPRKYLTPDLSAIGAAVRSLGMKAEIPGIQVFEEKSEHVRG